MRLNDPGQSNGVHEFWIDGPPETRRESLDFVGTYAGSPEEQERYFDNIVVSTHAIGCN